MTKARDIASAAPAPSTVSATELGYLDGVSSAIQTQIDGKVASSLVDAKGDLLVGSADNTLSRLAVSDNGSTLVADSSTSTGLRYSAIAGANLLAGGSFDIWQRGTGAFTANQAYTSDRFFTYSSSAYSLSQETSVVPSGATNSAKVTITSANGYSNHQFALEQSDVEKIAGQTVTFSVYLRANATYNGTFSVGINTSTTGNSQTPTWTQLASNSPITPSTSAFVRYSVTGTIPTTAKGVAFFVNQNAVLANGSIYYIALAKAEIGSVATPWSRTGVTLAGELAACQRYYYVLADGNTQSFGTCAYYSSTDVLGTAFFPVTMRTAPTFSAASGSFYEVVRNSAADGLTGLQANYLTTRTANIFAASTEGASGTAGHGGQYRTTSASANIAFSAEL